MVYLFNILFNIFCLLASFIAFVGIFHYRRNYQKTKLPQFIDFSFASFFISLAYFFLFLPKVVLFDPFWVQVDLILVDLSFLVSGIFAIPVIFSFFGLSELFQKRIPFIISSLFIIYIILNIFFFSPAELLFSQGNLIFFKNGVFWLHSLLWIPVVSLPGIVGGIFLIKIRTAEKKLFWKGLLLGIGSIIIFLAGILFWYLKFFNPSLLILNISGAVGILGFSFSSLATSLFPSTRKFFVKKII